MSSLYLPKDKSDFDSIQALKKISKSEIKKLLPQLFDWTQDINWPIAPLVINELLLPLGNDLVPYLKRILRSDEFDWIQVILYHLVKKLSREVLAELEEDILVIAQNKNKRFLEFEIPEIAKEILVIMNS